MNTVDYCKSMIAMPEAPFWLSPDGENLQHESISIFINATETVHGKLEQFDYAGRFLILAEDQTATQRKLGFHEFSYLSFQRTYQFNPEALPNFLTSDAVEYPLQENEFEIALTNARDLQGTMLAYQKDDAGVHLYKNSADSVTRLFIPAASITRARLGNRLGDELLSMNLLTPKQVSQVLLSQNQSKNKKIGEYLLEYNYLQEEEIENVLKLQKLSEYRLSSPRKLGEILIQEGILSKKQLEEALERQAQKKSEKFGEKLLNLGFISDAVIHRILARKLFVPFVLIARFPVDKSLVEYVPYEISRKYGVIPLARFNDRLYVAINDPLDAVALREVKRASNSDLEIAIAGKADIEQAWVTYYGSQVISDNIEALEKFHYRLATKSGLQQNREDELANYVNASPVVTLLDNLLQDAVARGVQEIHIRPARETVNIFYRQEKRLAKSVDFHIALLQLVIARLKVLAGIDLEQDQSPRFAVTSISLNNKVIRLRISFITTASGDSAVIRLDTDYLPIQSLAQAGMRESSIEQLMTAGSRSTGLMLVVGDRSAGKTSTAYALISELLAQKKYVLTLENPIERRLDGVEQIVVNSCNADRYSSLKYFISRNQPDLVYIGDLEDSGRAELAAALVRHHLVLSTLEADSLNKAAEYLHEYCGDASQTGKCLTAVMIQKLARKNCQFCLQPDVTETLTDLYPALENNDGFYSGTGCDHCHGTGFDGRVMVYELITDELMLEYLFNNTGVIADREKKGSDIEKKLADKVLDLARAGVISLHEASRLLVAN